MKKQKGFSMVELILVLVIISVASYFAVKTFFKGASGDKETKQAIAKEGVNTDNYGDMVSKAKDRTRAFNEETMKRQKSMQKEMQKLE